MSIIGDGIMLGAGGETASISVTGLSETDTVTATKDGKSIAGKWTQIPNPVAHGLPNGYTELEYIESTGTQYIDTGVVPSSKTNIDMTFAPVGGTSSDWRSVFGARTTNTSNDNFTIWWTANAMTIGVSYSTADIVCSVDISSTVKYRIKNIGSVFYLEDTQIGSTSSQITPGTKTARIFNSDSESNYPGAPIRLYDFIWEEDSVIIRQFVPCKRNSDSAIGLYDLVSNTFFENAGTGTFVAGAEVPQTIDGFLIDKIKSYGTWTVSNGDGTKTTDVLIDAAAEFEVAL